MNLYLKILVFFIIFFSLFKIKKFYSNIQISKKYFLIFDNLLSEEYSTMISDYINKNLINIKPKEFCTKLIEEFPFIKRIIIKRKNPEFLTVKINVYEPILKINDNLIFCAVGKVFNSKIYHENLTDDLSIIEINSNIDGLINDLNKFVSSLPEFIKQDFKIDWINKNKILLKSKDENNLFLLIKFDKIPIQMVVDKCKKLYHEYISNLKQKNKKEIFCDLRFSDQIIFWTN